MPRVTRADRRLLYGTGIGVVLMCVVAALLIAGTGDPGFPSSYSTSSGGAKAAYLLLKESGYETERWLQPPAELDQAERTTLILAEPQDMPTPEDRRALEQFVERGGRLIVTGTLGSLFVGVRAMPDLIGALTWTRVEAVAPSAITRAAPSISIAPASELDEGVGAALYGANPRVVVHVGMAAGDAFWWAAPTPLTNAGLREPGNLEFLLASVGERGRRRVLFDEYFHGERPTLAGSVMQTPAKWVGVQLALLAIAVLLTFSRRSGPIIPPATEPRLSPLEFARTLGSLYERARAANVPVDVALRRFRFALARRFGLSPNAPAETLARAAGGRSAVDTAALTDTLRACDAAMRSAGTTPARALVLVQALEQHAKDLHLYPTSDKGTA